MEGEWGSMTAPAGEKIHVHVVNDPDISPSSYIDEQKFWGAFKRAHALKGRVHLSIGSGERGLIEALGIANVIVANRLPQRKIVGKAPKLKWIHQISAGIDHLLPLDWLPEHIILTNSSGVHVPKVGEFITCALLMLNSLMPLHVSNQRQHHWVQVVSDYIKGKTLVIIGVGTVGGEAARQAKQLGLRVIGLRQRMRRHPYVDRMYRPHQLREVLPLADFVLITAPLTPGTIGLVGRVELDLLKPTASLLNMGRAAIVDYTALAEKLTNGELRGAILDVFDPEPLPENSTLWDCPNLIITPHSSIDAPDYSERVLSIFVDNLRRLASSKPLRNRIRREQGY
jgi:phosphoglycerate dehydrogenase-like enzyme